MSWHDCHVHGLRVAEGQYGAGEFELDLDYIVEWRRVSDGITFLIVPARLTFHEVTTLRIKIDWATPSAGLGPLSLAGVERRSEVRPRYTAPSGGLPSTGRLAVSNLRLPVSHRLPGVVRWSPTSKCLSTANAMPGNPSFNTHLPWLASG